MIYANKTCYTKHGHNGFALFVAIAVISIILLVSVALTNISLKQTLIASSGRESQRAFYAADNAIECALYWIYVNPGEPGTDPFSPSDTQSISCLGGVGMTVGGAQTSEFSLEFPDGTCAEVEVSKTGGTIISARGRNDCDTGNARRVERGVRVEY